MAVHWNFSLNQSFWSPLTDKNNRNISWGGKRGRCIGLTNLASSGADCFQIWKPQLPGTVRDCPGLHRDNFTFILSSHLQSFGFAENFAKPGPVVFKKFYQTSSNKIKIKLSPSSPVDLLQRKNTDAYWIQWRTEGSLGCSTPLPQKKIPKISVESSIAWARRTGVSISFCSSLCSHTVVIY